MVAGHQQGGCKQKTSGFRGHDIRGLAKLAKVFHQACENGLVLDERHDIDKIYTLDGEVGIELENLFVVHCFILAEITGREVSIKIKTYCYLCRIWSKRFCFMPAAPRVPVQ